MSPRSLVACGALSLVALANARLSRESADAAAALSEVATNAIEVFQGGSSGVGSALASAEPAMREMRAKVAKNDGLMKRLAGCAGEADASEAGQADDAEAVVCTLSRAVHSAVGASLGNQRPAAMAAMHRWDALGTVAGPSGNPVAASDVRGLALLLGVPDKLEVDGAAALAFRALEGAAREMGVSIGAVAEKEDEKEDDHWPRLQQTAGTVTAVLGAPATSCFNLLGGKDTYAAPLAALSPMEQTVCRWVVRLCRAVRTLHTLGKDDNISDDPFHGRLADAVGFVSGHMYVAVLYTGGNPVVGPVMGGAPPRGGDSLNVFATGGRAELWPLIHAVSGFLSMADAARARMEIYREHLKEKNKMIGAFEISGAFGDGPGLERVRTGFFWVEKATGRVVGLNHLKTQFSQRRTATPASKSLFMSVLQHLETLDAKKPPRREEEKEEKQVFPRSEVVKQKRPRAFSAEVGPVLGGELSQGGAVPGSATAAGPADVGPPVTAGGPQLWEEGVSEELRKESQGGKKASDNSQKATDQRWKKKRKEVKEGKKKTANELTLNVDSLKFQIY